MTLKVIDGGYTPPTVEEIVRKCCDEKARPEAIEAELVKHHPALTEAQIVAALMWGAEYQHHRAELGYREAHTLRQLSAFMKRCGLPGEKLGDVVERMAAAGDAEAQAIKSHLATAR